MTPTIVSRIAPTTKPPIVFGLVSLAMPFVLFRCRAARRRLRLGVEFAAKQEIAHLRVRAFVAQLSGIALGNHRFGIGVEEHRVVADGEYAGELVSDDRDGGAQAVAQLQ